MARSVPSIGSGAIKKLLTALQENGVDPAPLAAEVGIDPNVVEDPDARVPVEALHALWEAAQRRIPRADAALFGATRYAPGDYGLVGFVCMNSATLGEALGHAVRYLHLWTDDPGMTLDREGTLTVVYRTHFPDRLGLRLANEAALAEILQGARLTTGTEIKPVAVQFAHPAPDDVREHDAFFGVKVEFGRPTTAMRFTPEQLATPLPKADVQLGAFLSGLANDALAKREPQDQSPLDRVREIVAEELQSGVPELRTIARRLAVSERTLRRRLADQATTFRALLDDTRAELARSYIRDRRIPLTEVAFLLGFSEPSAFHRAFRRWTGSTPAEQRRQASG
jgi:AraC-like DNA-binding protein